MCLLQDKEVGKCRTNDFPFFFSSSCYITNLNELIVLQGLNYVAALLLLVMKTEEDAFWMLAVLLENVLVNDCYTNNLSGCHVEQRVFKDLLTKKCPRYSLFCLCNYVFSLMFLIHMDKLFSEIDEDNAG